MSTKNSNKKVFVGMSGGVDSSVSAYLLKEQGFDVYGVFMKNWSGDNFGIQADCPWERDQEDANKVCELLGIPFMSFNFEKEYREKVVEYFFSEYKAGRTPNPDVMCNKEIKFKLFLEKALEEGADFIATGHYVRKINEAGTDYLLKGVDNKKDQSYFLCAISQAQLNKSLFPIGGYEKSEIREIAKEIGLHNAEKPDSQGICFIGEINVREFIKQRLGEKSGEIIDIDTKEVVGSHNGAWFYTVGQREGLGIGGAKEPYYVVGTSTETNSVFVAMGSSNPALYKSQMELDEFHLLSPKTENIENEIENLANLNNLSASIRYRHKPQPGKLIVEGNKIVWQFETPQRAVTTGQLLSIYQNEKLLASGVINS